jgi:uncharacterized protein (DUF4415 family)
MMVKLSELFLQERQTNMKVKFIWKKSKTNWDKLNTISDSEIDYSDIPKLSKEIFQNSKLRMTKSKPLISIRLDSDILEWFKSLGTGYQTRINAVLRMYMDVHKNHKRINK